MIALLSHHCRSCTRGWVATTRGPVCPFCGSHDVLVGGKI